MKCQNANIPAIKNRLQLHRRGRKTVLPDASAVNLVLDTQVERPLPAYRLNCKGATVNAGLPINAALSPMSEPNQTDLLDRMIARLEKANASAHERLADQRETALKSEQEAALKLPDPRPPQAPEQQSSRARPLFVGLLTLMLVAVGVAAFAWQPSYIETVTAFVRSSNPWGSGALSQAQLTIKAAATVTPSISPEITQQLRKMADDLANAEQQIERLKASQEETIQSDATMSELFKASQQQIVRDNAKAIEQLNAALAQITLKSDAFAEQLKRSQEQLAELASFRAMASMRKQGRRSRSPIQLHR